MKTNSKRIMSISLVLVLTLVAIAPASLAKPEKDSKIKVESVTWDKGTQEFVVEMSCKFGLANAGDHAGFLISAELQIQTDDNYYTLDSKDNPIHMQQGAEKGKNGYIEIEPKHIPWDRNGGSEEGKGIVTVIAGFKNPKGRNIGNRPVEFTFTDVLIAPAPRPIYVVNEYDNTVFVIDSSKVDDGIPGNEVIDVIYIDFNGLSSLIDVDNSRGRVYVGGAMIPPNDHDRISVIDETTIDDGISGNEVIDVITWELPPRSQYPPMGATFWGVKVCEFHQNIWVTAAKVHGLFVFNSLTGDLVAEIRLHLGPVFSLPFSLDIDESRNLVYIASNGINKVDVIDENRIDDGILGNEVIDSIDVGDQPYGLAFDVLRNRIYVTNQKDDTVSVIDGFKVADGISGNEIIDTIAVGSMPSLVGIDRSRNRIYIANQGDGTVSVIDGSKVNDMVFGNEVIDIIEVGSGPLGVAVDRLDNKIYVTNHDANTVAVIDGLRIDDGILGNEVINTITVGNGPGGVVVSNFALP